MLKDQFKEALAEILFGPEIDKIVRHTFRWNRRKIRAFEDTVKQACRMDRRNLAGMSMVPLIDGIPTLELWQAVIYKMVANDARERFLGEDEAP